MSRKPGLLHGPRRIEVEAVRKAHKKKCEGCGRLPRERRLKVVNGTARSADTMILCVHCGIDYIGDRKEEYDRAIDYLLKGEGEIRIPKQDWEVARDRAKREAAKARKEKA